MELKQLEDLKEIRQMMARHERFLSLSGLSGISAGVFALAGACFANARINTFYEGNLDYHRLTMELVLTGVVVLLLALATAFYFTWDKVRRNGEQMWTALSKDIFVKLAMPLLVGGIFALMLLKHELISWMGPTMLIFYGLACISASPRTLKEIFWLGLTVLIIGIISLFFLGYGLIFWTLGFGVCHIIYGTMMYLKHDRKK